MNNRNIRSQLGARQRAFAPHAYDEFILGVVRDEGSAAAAASAGGGISARSAPAAESESELLLLIEARNWEQARIRAEAFAAEARPTSAAYRGISQTALSSAVKNGAPLETVRAILKANPDALVKVRHARRGTVLHEAIRYRANVDVISFLVDEALDLEEALRPVVDDDDSSSEPAAAAAENEARHAILMIPNRSRKTPKRNVPIWGQVDDLSRTILHHMVSRICSDMVQATPRSTAAAASFRAPPRFRADDSRNRPPTPQDIDKMAEICGKIAGAYPEALTMVNMDGHTPLMMALAVPPPGSFALKDLTSFIDRTIEKLVAIFCDCQPIAVEKSITPNQIMGIMSGASLQRVARGGIRHVNRQHEVLVSCDEYDQRKQTSAQTNKLDPKKDMSININVGPNALYTAIVHHRSVETIEMLLTANPSSNRSAYAIVTQQLETPLHVAVTLRAPIEILRLLLQHGPEAAIAGDRHNLTPLDWTWIRHVLDRAYLAGRSNGGDGNDSDSDGDAQQQSVVTLPQFEPNRPYVRRNIPSTFLQNWKDAATEIELLSEAMNGSGKTNKRMRVGSFTNYRATTGALWEKVSLMLPVAARAMYRLLEQSNEESSVNWPVYHAAAYVPCPVPLLDLAFFYYPDQVQQKDDRGFLPIHYAVSNPYHDVTFDIPESLSPGVSPYVRAQHRASFCDLSPIPRVIKHFPEGSHIATPDGRLPLHIALEMIKDHQSTFRVACQSPTFTSVSSKNKAVPWEVSRAIIRSLVEANTASFERQDPQTRLYPFMQAAVGDNADVDSIFMLLREHPSICMAINRSTKEESAAESKSQQDTLMFDEKLSPVESMVVAKYAIGQPIQKVFGARRYEGMVTMLPTPSSPYYRVFYPADEDEEDISPEDMPKYAVSNVGGLRHPDDDSNWPTCQRPS